jgi:hypothetical protein
MGAGAAVKPDGADSNQRRSSSVIEKSSVGAELGQFCRRLKTNRAGGMQTTIMSRKLQKERNRVVILTPSPLTRLIGSGDLDRAGVFREGVGDRERALPRDTLRFITKKICVLNFVLCAKPRRTGARF